MADTTSLLHSAEALLALLDAPASEQQSAWLPSMTILQD